ncbi:hypothetical protein BK809_0000607 [Diplodia seriata]|uniref:Peptidase A1 domain-containing protein n=1 Tax=Diplodia seriata TaxID=420778 RepID=A0A1S8BHI7_9PEZI|nr:hypothetical protein BK809_0000607 [Diplodia seriata]
MAADPVPTPYVALPTKQWDGIDGNWSTFGISIGNPGQNFRVLVSTRADSPWVTIPEGCKANDQTCPSSRGVDLSDSQPSRGFRKNQSHTWEEIGIFGLELEKDLGYAPLSRGYYGYDTIQLGFSQQTTAMRVNHSQVVAYAEPDYWLGYLGMSSAQMTLVKDEVPSLLQVLNDTGKIPSQSYGYTAGSHYRNNPAPGSLVIGGCDQSRFQPPVHSFPFAQDRDQFLIVGVQSIFTNFSLEVDVGPENLVGTSHMSMIDSSVSQLWLPEDSCNHFAAAFGLTYDENLNYYLINDTMHDRLLAENPALTFRFGNDITSATNESVDITLPYAAFDLYIKHPDYPDTTRYFPIRRAHNDTQYTLGRVLLQEAYLTVDYERGNFSLAQANYSDPMPASDIRTIHTLGWSPRSPSPALSSGAKVGIAVGAVVGVVLALVGAYLCWWRPRRQSSEDERKKRPSVASAAPTSTYLQEPPPHYQEGKHYDYWATMQQGGQQRDDQRRHSSVMEMATGVEHQARRPELDGVGVGGGSYELPVEEQGRERPVHEMDVGVGDAAAVTPAAAAVAGEGSEGVEARR